MGIGNRGWRRLLVVAGGLGLASWFIAIPQAQTVAGYRPALPGWLYVLTSDERTFAGQLAVVNPREARAVGSLKTGYKPDLVQSLNGQTLYIGSDRFGADGRLTGVFDVVDAATGALRKRFHEAESRGGMPGFYRSRMALSKDGTRVFRYKHWVSETGVESYWLESFDTLRNVTLPGKVTLTLCGDAVIQPLDQRDSVVVVCSKSADVRFVSLSDTGSEAAAAAVSLGAGMKEGFSPIALPRDGGRALTVIKPDGSVVNVDTATRAVVGRDAVDRLARRVGIPEDRPARATRPVAPNADDWLAGRALSAPAGAALSPDGSRIYGLLHGNEADEIVVLEAGTLNQISTISLKRHYASITVSGDGSELYAVESTRELLGIIDAQSGREKRDISGLGYRPVFGVVAR